MWALPGHGHWGVTVSSATLGATWVKNHWAVQPSSTSQVLETVARIGALYSDKRLVWRGVPNYRYELQPSVLRAGGFSLPPSASPDDCENAVAVYEKELLKHALKWGLYRQGGTFATDLHVLAHVQHNNAERRFGTRLLDVSSNPHTALRFATEDLGTSGMVFAINVQDAPEISTHEQVQDGIIFGAQLERGDLAATLRRTKGELTLLRPEFPDPRMAAQSGSFLFSAYPPNAGELAKYGIRGIRLPAPVAPSDGYYDWLSGNSSRTKGRPSTITIFGVVVPTNFKRALRSILANTYRQDDHDLFPDVGGFIRSREAII